MAVCLSLALALAGHAKKAALGCAFGLLLLIASTTFTRRRDPIDPAAARGASHVPRVRGKLPLNFDVLLAWLHHAEEDVGRMFHDLSQQYGPTFNTRVLGEDQILSCDPAVFDAVMNDQFSHFPKGPKFRYRAKGLLGEGIFNSDGEQWTKHRRVLRPFFKQDKIPIEAINRILTEALEQQETGVPFDAQALFGDVAMDLALLFITGLESSHNVADERDWRDRKRIIGKALSEGQRVMGRRLKVGSIWPIFELRRDGLKGPSDTLRSFFRPIVLNAVKRCQAENLSTGSAFSRHASGISLLDALVVTVMGDRPALEEADERYIEDELVNVLLAARDTTTSLLTFLTLTMITQPDAFHRVKEEMMRQGDLDTPDGYGFTTNAQSPASLFSIKHTWRHAFIMETLRLFPPVPMNIRRSAEPVVLPGNLYVPAGVSVVLSTITMQRSKLFCGDDADEFRLDRWLDGETDRACFRAFNTGPRTCPGRHLAQQVASAWLEVLANHFIDNGLSLDLAGEAQPAFSRVPTWWGGSGGDGRGRGGREKIWPVSDIILTVKGGLWVKTVSDKGPR